jgi:prolyl-tRNA synthetase
MQDGKALSWYVTLLGQNFAKAFDVKFANAEGSRNMWGTSWGFRLV